MLRRKYTTFSVPISKELDNGKIITYKLNFIDSFSFILTSLSKLYQEDFIVMSVQTVNLNLPICHLKIIV